MKQSISVALATFNEEKNLSACLDSVKGLADEIVVVDGSSTDKTVEVAKKYGAKVIVTNNPPIFHINKQKAIDACAGDWILQLDADERVSPALREEILQVTTATPRRKPNPAVSPRRSASHTIRGETINGYWIPRKNYFLGRYLTKGGQYPDYTLRLYRRGKGRLPCESVHEQAVVDGEVGYLKSDLLHIADPTFKRYLERNSRYINLIVDELTQQKVKKNLIQFLNYFLIKPTYWFFLTQIRHKGFLDGFQGIIFSFFSGLRFPRAYWRYLKRKNIH